MKLTNQVSFLLTIGLTAFSTLSTAHASKGGSSGGGGFYKNAPQELNIAINDLSNRILGASPSVVSGIYPQWTTQGWTLENFARVIKNTRSEPGTPSTPRPGSDQPLLFNYGIDASGPYLVALHDFFSSFEGSTVYPDAGKCFLDLYYRGANCSAVVQENGVISDIEHRLLHEFSHLLGIGVGSDNDGDSDIFADKVYTRLSDCSSSNPNDISGNIIGSDLWNTEPADQNTDQLAAKLGKSTLFYKSGDNQSSDDLDHSQKVSIQIKGADVDYSLKRSWQKNRKGALIFTQDGLMDSKNPELVIKVVTQSDSFHPLAVIERNLHTKSNACGDPVYFYSVFENDNLSN